MSNAQFPGQGGQQNSPWASQDPNWRPQQFRDAGGRDPRQPFGQQPAPQQPQPDWSPEPPRGRGKRGWLVVGVVALIVVVVLAMQFFGGPASDPAASPSPTPAAAQPTATRTGNYIPFEGNGDGIFEIVSYSWDGDNQLNLRVRVEVTDSGEYSFAIFAFTNETRASFDPTTPVVFAASQSSPFEGDFTFLMPKADSTIVLTTPTGRIALNALPVSG